MTSNLFKLVQIVFIRVIKAIIKNLHIRMLMMFMEKQKLVEK